MNTAGFLLVALGVFLVIEALKNFSGSKAVAQGGGLGVRGAGVGAAGRQAGEQAAQGAAAVGQGLRSLPGGRLLPESWYAAIQANESLLPLPGPGSPQPMFGITPGADSGYAVDVGVYPTGGTNDVGAGPGRTRQALFPSVESGLAAFDALVRRFGNQAAFDAIAQGDFGGFLRAIAPWYAGGSETGPWPGQVLSHYQPGATLTGAPALPPVPGVIV